MAGLIKTNKDVYTSYLFTVAKYDFSVYEKRIVYRLIELAQMEIEGLLLKDNLRKIHHQQKCVEITMPIASILKDERDENYTIAKKAFKTLSGKGLEYEDDDIWVFINIIAAPKFDKKRGTATFVVFDEIWQCLLNFTKGFRKYEMKTIMNFKSTYSMRMYELMSGQQTPLRYVDESFDDLCERFKIPASMRKPQAFETYILNIAQKELDEFSPYSFTYRRETIPSRGRTGQKVIGYTFFPVSIPKNRDEALERARLAAKVGNIAGRYGMLDQSVSAFLEHLGFTKEEINRNKELMVEAQKLFSPDGMIDKLDSIRRNALRKKFAVANMQGYLINGLKNAIKETGQTRQECYNGAMKSSAEDITQGQTTLTSSQQTQSQEPEPNRKNDITDMASLLADKFSCK